MEGKTVRYNFIRDSTRIIDLDLIWPMDRCHHLSSEKIETKHYDSK